MTQDFAAWAPLLPVAMVGTDRHAAPLPRWPAAVGDTLAALVDGAGEDSAATVLRVAGVLAVCGRAGAQPRSPVPAPVEAAAADTDPAVDDRELTRWILWALQQGPETLKKDFLLRFAHAGMRLPPALLPTALDQARQSLALRALIQPVLGERGVWLARQRADWGFAAGVVATDENDPRQWDIGTLEQRKAFLRVERTRDPRAARERLAAALSGLPAKERAELAQILEVGLCMDDEPLLDQLRADRGQDVRAVALGLLLRLPDAAHPRRATARVAALMSRGSLLTGRRWQIEPPVEAAADWKADQVDAVAPNDGRGPRAWWLYQLVRQVPLAWWCEQLGTDARGVADWSHGSDWGESLWRGWRDVLRQAPSPDWAELFIDEPTGKTPRWSGGGEHYDRVMAMSHVTPAARERWVLRQLASADASPAVVIWAVTSTCAPGETVDPSLVRPLVDRIRRTLAKETPPGGDLRDNDTREQHSTGAALPDLACILPLSALADFEEWSQCPSDTPSIAGARYLARQIIQARRALANLLA